MYRLGYKLQDTHTPGWQTNTWIAAALASESKGCLRMRGSRLRRP